MVYLTGFEPVSWIVFDITAIPLCDSSKNKNKNAEITRLYGISFVTLSSRCNPKGSSLIHKLPEWTAQSVRHRYLLFRVVAVLPSQRYNRLSNFPRPCGPFTDANLLGASFNQIRPSLRLFWILHSLTCGELGNLLLPLVVRALHFINDNGNRTHDLLFSIQSLYQLSYILATPIPSASPVAPCSFETQNTTLGYTFRTVNPTVWFFTITCLVLLRTVHHLNWASAFALTRLTQILYTLFLRTNEVGY